MAVGNSARARIWTNLLVALAAAYAIAAAVWFPPEMWASDPVRSEVGIGVTYAVAGVLGFGAMVVATKWRRIAQAMLVAAAIAMLLSFATLGELTLLAVLSIGGTAAIFLVSAPFFGDTPAPGRSSPPAGR